eukprot:g1394.t1
MDGDRYDNTNKLLVKEQGGAPNTGTMKAFDDVLTLDAVGSYQELDVGDAVRVADELFMIRAITPGSDGRDGANDRERGDQLKLDHDRLTAIGGIAAGFVGAPVYRHLETIAATGGTWESWPGDFSTHGDEGHFYMECSNRGQCDRQFGFCVCFEGYEGAACDRQTCGGTEGVCNQRGVCTPVRQMREAMPPAVPGLTVSSSAGSRVLVPDTDPVAAGLAAGDVIKLGVGRYESRTGSMVGLGAVTARRAALQVRAVTATSVELFEPAKETLPHGTRVFVQRPYDLWDSAHNRACVCDPGFSGPTCADRDCPLGDDPLTVYEEPSGTTDLRARGATPFLQANEKQTVYLGATRGMVSGSFRLGLVDTHGKQWWTPPIGVDEQLSGYATIASAGATTVAFSPGLPYGELEAGDVLMVGDMYSEVLTTLPAPPAAPLGLGDPTDARPLEFGGVVTSVTVRSPFPFATAGAYAFRVGPAKQIRRALVQLPGGALRSEQQAEEHNSGGGGGGSHHYAGQLAHGAGGASGGDGFLDDTGVVVEKLAGGTLVGYAQGSAVNTLEGTIVPLPNGAGLSGHTALLKDVRANYNGRSTVDAASAGIPVTSLAPQDRIRFVNAGGVEELHQVFDVYHGVEPTTTSGIIQIQVDGPLSAAPLSSGLGIGAGKSGAIFRDGGHAVRVSFMEKSGDLPEMECDAGDLEAVFRREFSASVLASHPKFVETRLHSGAAFAASAHFQADGTTIPNLGYRIRLRTGMRIRVGGQVRTVISLHTDHATHPGAALSTSLATGSGSVSGFFVDRPFEVGALSRTVADLPYVLYRYPVEQLYDTITWYQGLRYGVEIMSLDCNANNAVIDAPSSSVTTMNPHYWDTYFAVGDRLVITGATSNTGGANVANNLPCLVSAVTSSAFRCEGIAFTSATCLTDTLVLRKYVDTQHLVGGTARPVRTGATAGASGGNAQYATDVANPPMASCYVTDQRPLNWAAPTVANQVLTSVQESHAAPGYQGHTLKAGAGQTVVVHCAANTITVDVGVGTYAVATAVNFDSYFSVGNVVQVSGGTQDTNGLGTANNVDCYLTAVSSTTLTCGSGAPASSVVCTSDKDIVVFSLPHGSLVDSKAAVAGDRVKLKRGVGDYETRTVDEVFGSGLDVTMLSVADTFSSSPSSLVRQSAYAWVDESGTTEALECSRRGVCNRKPNKGDC